MIHEEMTALYEPWYNYQQPSHPSSGISATFRTLLAAIDQGWEVSALEQIVSDRPAMAKSFVFTLAQKTSGNVFHLTVMSTPAVEQFISGNGDKKWS